MQKFVAVVLWIGCCVSVSKQACFSTNCTLHNLADCVSGNYQCQPSEFCEITSLESAGVRTVGLQCRPNAERHDCEATATVSGTTPTSAACVPGNRACYWCCSDADCVKQLARTETAFDCSDAYGGDCATDFPGVCDVSYVQEVCAKTCGVCT